MDSRKIVQNINGEVNGNVNMAAGDINLSYNYNRENTEKVLELLCQIRKCIDDIGIEQVVGAEEKENVLDDIDNLEEQYKKEKVSAIKIRKAIAGISAFAKRIPNQIAGATMLITKVTELQDVVQKFIENIS